MKSRTVQPIRQANTNIRRMQSAPGYSDEKKKKKKGGSYYFDYNLLIVIIFLTCFGLVMLYSSSSYSAQAKFGNDMYYFAKQAIISAGCFGIMLLVSRINYHWYAPVSFLGYCISMFLMALVRWTPLGVESYGARRWLRMPAGLTLQPSEVMKVAIIVFIPYLICKMGKEATETKGIVKLLGYGGVAAFGVFYLTDNLSTAIIVMMITCIMIFVVHPKTKIFVLLISGTLIAGYAFLQILATSVADSTDFRMRRILAWLRPEDFATEESHQVTQALYAIGSGGFFGKGLGNSTQKMIIPEVQNDMILSVICEELGVFGAIVVLTLFGIMLYRLLFIARNAPDMYGALVATGIFAHIALQVAFNIAVVTRLFPTTGVTLPFISYGGTSILFLMVEMGIALGISTKIKIEED